MLNFKIRAKKIVSISLCNIAIIYQGHSTTKTSPTLINQFQTSTKKRPRICYHETESIESLFNREYVCSPAQCRGLCPPL